MARKSKRRKRSRAAVLRRRKLLLELAGAVLAAAALFWGFFYITSIEVVGNSGKNYTDEEIIEMSLPEFWTKNSVLLRLFHSTIELEDVRFMDSVDVEVRSRNEIRLHVNEKKPVGFVRLNDTDYYFDHTGIVLEIMSAEETALLKQEAAETEAAEILSSSLEESETAEGDGTEETADEESVQEFSPDLADVPMIAGLDVPATAVGEAFPIEDASVFNTIQFLTKMIDKFDIQPDYVLISESTAGEKEMTLYYGTVRAALGADSNLEEKITRLAAILPKLSGRSGVLHLEEYSSDTINIVFEEDQ